MTLIYPDGQIIQDKSYLVVDFNGYSIIGPGIESENTGIIIDNSKNIQINGLGEIKNFKHGKTKLWHECQQFLN